MEEKRVVTYQVNEYKCVSGTAKTVVDFKGNTIELESKGFSFTPLQLDLVKKNMPELYEELEAMWTPEVAKKYQDWLDSQPKLEA